METCRHRGTPEPPAQHPQGTDGRPSPSPSPGTCLRGRPRWRAGRSVGSPVRGGPPSPTPPGGPLRHMSNGSASRPGASAVTGGTRGAARCSLRFGAVTPREAGCTLHLRSFVRKLGGGHSFIGHREEEATNGPCLAPGRPEEPRMTWQPRAHPRANPAMGRRLGLQTAWRAGAQAPLEADPGRRARARGQCPVRGPWRERPGLRGCCRRTSQGPPQLLPWRGPELRGWSATPAPAPPRGAQRNGEQPAMLSPAVT